MNLELRRSINSAFKMNGFSLNGEASHYLIEILKDFSQRQQNLWLDKIIDKIQRQTLTTALISRAVVEAAARECGKGEGRNQEDILHVISAFDVPKFNYDPERKKFLLMTSTKQLLCDGPEKPLLYKHRYSILLQRTLHHHLFIPNVLGIEWEGEEGKKFNLKAIEFLSGSSTKIGELLVLGMITQLKEGKFFLEDPTGTVELDMSQTLFRPGFYAESCFVLAEGFYDDGIFHVTAVGLPPAEESTKSKVYYGTTNFFGGPSSSANRDRLELMEHENADASFVILSDVHLDNITSLQKLRVLFEGLAESRPALFLLMGNFLSDPHGAQSAVALRDALKNLADIIVEFPPLLENTKFVLVPGPSDPGFVNILPRPPFADVITKYFVEKVPNTVFTTNPCRIKYCTREIIVIREDILTKLSRNSIYYPTTGDIPETFVKTLIAQSHLCPLPLHVCPVYWSYDHALSLYPLPDLVIIADKAEPFSVKASGCQFINPGSFVKTNFSFKTYTPYENRVDDCQLPASE